MAVQFLDTRKVSLKRALQPRWQNGNTRMLPLAFLNGDAVVGKIDVFYAQPRRFQQSKTASVKEIGHKAIITFKVSEDSPRFDFRKNDREPGGTADTLDAVDEFQFAIEDVLIKKEQCAEGLVLSGSRDVTVNSKMAEEGSNFFFAHLVWVPFAMKKNKTPDPLDISLLSADTVTLDTQVPAHAVEKFGWRRRASPV